MGRYRVQRIVGSGASRTAVVGSGMWRLRGSSGFEVGGAGEKCSSIRSLLLSPRLRWCFTLPRRYAVRNGRG